MDSLYHLPVSVSPTMSITAEELSKLKTEALNGTLFCPWSRLMQRSTNFSPQLLLLPILQISVCLSD